MKFKLKIVGVTTKKLAEFLSQNIVRGRSEALKMLHITVLGLH